MIGSLHGSRKSHRDSARNHAVRSRSTEDVAVSVQLAMYLNMGIKVYFDGGVPLVRNDVAHFCTRYVCVFRAREGPMLNVSERRVHVDTLQHISSRHVLNLVGGGAHARLLLEDVATKWRKEVARPYIL